MIAVRAPVLESRKKDSCLSSNFGRNLFNSFQDFLLSKFPDSLPQGFAAKYKKWPVILSKIHRATSQHGEKQSAKSAGPRSFSIHQPKKYIPISREIAPWFSALFQLLSCPLAQKNSYWLLSVQMLLSLELKQSRKNVCLYTKNNICFC